MDRTETIDPNLVNTASLQDQIPKVSNMNRQERRNRIKYFEKMMEQHLKRKPKNKVNEVDENKQREYTRRVNTWIMRYGVLLRKLRELHGLDGNSKGSK